MFDLFFYTPPGIKNQYVPCKTLERPTHKLVVLIPSDKKDGTLKREYLLITHEHMNTAIIFYAVQLFENEDMILVIWEVSKNDLRICIAFIYWVGHIGFPGLF